MNTMPIVRVMMSTYNGEKYLSEQLDSILSQENVDVSIIIRDDGSKDNTLDIIENYVNIYNNIEYYEGENVGYRKSFNQLILDSGEYAYYAFSDQDDFWEKDKLFKAIEKIKAYNEKPTLYCSNLNVVSEDLVQMRMMHDEKERININKYQALVENFSYGCTTVFNYSLIKIAREHRPEYVSHDGWVNLIATYFGYAVYDDNSYIKYRQHGRNTLGGNRSFVSTWKNRIKSFKKLKEHHRDIEAKEFMNAYINRLEPNDQVIIKKVSDYRCTFRNRINLLFDRKIKMSTFDRDFWYRVRIIFSNI